VSRACAWNPPDGRRLRPAALRPRRRDQDNLPARAEFRCSHRYARPGVFESVGHESEQNAVSERGCASDFKGIHALPAR
jgi:hypothetical protein